MSREKKSEFRASLRESRMVVDRLLQYKRVPPGRRQAITDAGMYSAHAGLSGFPKIMDTITQLLQNLERSTLCFEDGDLLILDGQAKHAWAVAEEIVDVLVDRYRRQKGHSIIVKNIREPEELNILPSLAQKYSLSVEIAKAEAGAMRVKIVERNAELPTDLELIARVGIPVEKELWWGLFKTANEALAPDTKKSRMHTGTVVLAEDGKLIGTDDDEFLDMDISLLEKETIEEPNFEGTN